MRRMWAAGAAVMVGLALSGALALAQDASPAGSQGEVLYEITVPPEAIPDSLGKIVVDEWTVAPGTDVSIPYDNEGILGRGMYLESGGLTVTPAYDALLWTGEIAQSGSPVIAPAGEGVALAAGDVCCYPPSRATNSTRRPRSASPTRARPTRRSSPSTCTGGSPSPAGRRGSGVRRASPSGCGMN